MPGDEVGRAQDRPDIVGRGRDRMENLILALPLPLPLPHRNGVIGDVRAFSNKGGVRVFGNRIDGNLQCKSNDPNPVGDNNRVSGNKENQCQGF
jgi:hypothetical protein